MIQLDRIEDSEGIDLDKTDNQKNAKSVTANIFTMVLNLTQKFVISKFCNNTSK